MNLCSSALCSLCAVAAAFIAVSSKPAGAAQKPVDRPLTETLTQAGKPTATIVLAAKPTCAAAFAAAELQDHVRRITGVGLPILRDVSPASGTRILVGESVLTRQLGLTSASFQPREYVVRFRPHTIILMGKDKPEVAQSWNSRPTFVSGKFGKALSFNGLTKSVALPDSGFSDQEGTLEAWVWLPEQPSGQEGTIFRTESHDPWTYHIVGQQAKTRQLYYRVYDGATAQTIETTPLKSGWHHVAATHSVLSGRMELFVDGISQGKAAYRQTHCLNAILYLGGANETNANLFTGKIDEVRVSKIVRNQTPEPADGPSDPDAATTLLLHSDTEKTAGLSEINLIDGSTAPGFFEERGTLNAVYDFLERDCGVRWYAPTELGTVTPHHSTLIVRGKDIRRVPAMRYTWMVPTPLYMPTSSQEIPPADVLLWKLRMRMGGEAYSANHSFAGFADRFQKTHPEWFSGGQMCYTNPEFIRQVVRDADQFYHGKGLEPGSFGAGDYYALVPMDNNDWGACAQGLLDPTPTGSTLFFNSHASNYVWSFVNQVAMEVGKSHPNKYIAALAYWEYTYPPTKLKLAPNVAVQICLPARDEWHQPTKANDLKILQAWHQNQGSRPLYLWLYYNFPAMVGTNANYTVFPGFYAHTIVQQMKRYQQAGIRGIFMEHSSEFRQSYLQDQLELYVTLRLADDPNLNGNTLIEEFFTLYYGAAAAPMRQLYEGIEAVYSDPKNYPASASSTQTEKIAWEYLGTAERMAKWEIMMRQAQTLAKNPEEKMRVSNFASGIWNPMLAGRKAYAAKGKPAPP